MAISPVNSRGVFKRILDIEDALATVKAALEANETVAATVYLAMIQRESSGMLLDMWLLEECGEQVATPILEEIRCMTSDNWMRRA